VPRVSRFQRGLALAAASLVPVVAALSGLVAVSGCSSGVGQVEFVVYFAPDATDAQKTAVRDACPGVGKAVLEPRDRSNLQTARTYPVRYDITNASSGDRSAVIACVSKQPGVRGISQTDNGT
jgi:hypothetical protein